MADAQYEEVGERTMLKYLGSTIAMILGVLMILSMATQPQSSVPIAGVVTLLGALAYRSRKRRGLGEVPDTPLRKGLEIVALVVSFLAILLQTNLKQRLVLDPVPNLLPILWVFIAYVAASLRKYPTRSVQGERIETFKMPKR